MGLTIQLYSIDLSESSLFEVYYYNNLLLLFVYNTNNCLKHSNARNITLKRI